MNVTAEQELIHLIEIINKDPNVDVRRGMRGALNYILSNRLNPNWIEYSIDWSSSYIDQLDRIPRPETICTFEHPDDERTKPLGHAIIEVPK